MNSLNTDFRPIYYREEVIVESESFIPSTDPLPLPLPLTVPDFKTPQAVSIVVKGKLTSTLKKGEASQKKYAAFLNQSNYLEICRHVILMHNTHNLEEAMKKLLPRRKVALVLGIINSYLEDPKEGPEAGHWLCFLIGTKEFESLLTLLPMEKLLEGDNLVRISGRKMYLLLPRFFEAAFKVRFFHEKFIKAFKSLLPQNQKIGISIFTILNKIKMVELADEIFADISLDDMRKLADKFDTLEFVNFLHNSPILTKKFHEENIAAAAVGCPKFFWICLLYPNSAPTYIVQLSVEEIEFLLRASVEAPIAPTFHADCLIASAEDVLLSEHPRFYDIVKMIIKLGQNEFLDKFYESLVHLSEWTVLTKQLLIGFVKSGFITNPPPRLHKLVQSVIPSENLSGIKKSVRIKDSNREER